MAVSGKPNVRVAPPPLRVTIDGSPEERRELLFRKSFQIGRGDDCGVCIKDYRVSRVHADVAFEDGQWWVRDLNSSNGIFICNEQIDAAPIAGKTVLNLGPGGPTVLLEVEQAPPNRIRPQKDDATITNWVEHYFGKGGAESIGDHTMMIRRAYQHVQKKQKWKYGWIIGVLALSMIGAGGYTLYLHQQVRHQKAIAEDIFYSMKSLDVDIANLETLVQDSNNQRGMDEIRKHHGRRQEMEKNYNRFLATLHVYNNKLSEQEQIILRIARVFGECELNMPRGFTAEIGNYIKKWQSSDRFVRGIRAAKEKGYTARISEELLAQNLPPQFFYLALQESNFEPYISGPPTRKGIAKGMWQFIPETALKYGLRLGPLVDLRRPDPSDDRHDWGKATKAAARYLKDLYSTDAQASGLLVMASYNWGEDRVLPLIRSMPANPRERNFWRLLESYRDKLPQETYDYVLYIASAAVIGENPRLFGFDLDNPLGS